MDKKQNGIWHDPTNGDNRMSENVEDIRASPNFHHESYGKLELTTGGQTNRGKNPKRHFLGRFIIATTIGYRQWCH